VIMAVDGIPLGFILDNNTQKGLHQFFFFFRSKKSLIYQHRKNPNSFNLRVKRLDIEI